MWFFKSGKDELIKSLQKELAEMEEIVCSTDTEVLQYKEEIALYKSNYEKQGDILGTLQGDVKDKVSELLKLRATVIDLGVEIKSKCTLIQEQETKIKELKSNNIDTSKIVIDINDYKIKVMELEGIILKLSVENKELKVLVSDETVKAKDSIISELLDKVSYRDCVIKELNTKITDAESSKIDFKHAILDTKDTVNIVGLPSVEECKIVEYECNKKLDSVDNIAMKVSKKVY